MDITKPKFHLFSWVMIDDKIDEEQIITGVTLSKNGWSYQLALITHWGSPIRKDVEFSVYPESRLTELSRGCIEEFRDDWNRGNIDGLIQWNN